jgi:hypothetical protein
MPRTQYNDWAKTPTPNVAAASPGYDTRSNVVDTPSKTPWCESPAHRESKTAEYLKLPLSPAKIKPPRSLFSYNLIKPYF